MVHTLFAAGAQAVCDSTTGATCDTGLPTVAASGSSLQLILQIIIGIVAAVAVLMIVVGGLRFVMSEGNPEATKTARNTIVYSLIGLVIAASAEAIVSFFLSKA